MKKSKMLTAVFAVLAAVSAARAEGIMIDFDGRGLKGVNSLKADFNGKKGAPLFAQLFAQAGQVPAAFKAGDMMPGRPAPVFTARELSGMDKAIEKAISHAGKNMKNPGLKANLECLRLNAATEEKFSFVYAAPGSAYKFPEGCSSKQTKDWIDDLLTWVCESVWVPVCKETCSLGVEDGETIVLCIEDCNDQLVESCSWI
ncbi:MAG: hypothetical protein Q8O90_07920 [Elusimicrobiota bacterium]|nr:hypothetical protein [Elusimicrobiota bacterium]